MDKVTVRKEELLEILRANRENHKESYVKAFEGYRIECMERLHQYLKDFSEGTRIQLSWRETPPEDHTSDYDQIIKMAEMSIADNIELSNQEFQNYVMDNWHWKDAWMVSNASYITKASTG